MAVGRTDDAFVRDAGSFTLRQGEGRGEGGAHDKHTRGGQGNPKRNPRPRPRPQHKSWRVLLEEEGQPTYPISLAARRVSGHDVRAMRRRRAVVCSRRSSL